MIKDIKTALKIKPKTWELRAFGIILGLILIFLAYKTGAAYLNRTAAIILAAAILLPRLLKYPVIGLIILTTPVGWIISRLVLVVFFYLVVTPIALIRRLSRHDALHLKPGNSESYWEKLEENAHHDKMHL